LPEQEINRIDVNPSEMDFKIPDHAQSKGSILIRTPSFQHGHSDVPRNQLQCLGQERVGDTVDFPRGLLSRTQGRLIHDPVGDQT
jgi:hypothetical protein